MRPIGWLESCNAQVGSSIYLVVSEQGLDGLADVLAIEPCPRISLGIGRVVTGTFTHVRGGILRIKLAGLAEPLGVTSNHSIYSSDRLDFVPAGELSGGETLRNLDGDVRIESIEQLGSEERVYNLEIHGEHVFRVASNGVLVHNSSEVAGPLKPVAGSTRHIDLERADNGGYRIEFESGMGYGGKGGTNRARQSARRHSRENNDPVKKIEHFPAGNDKEAFDIEATFLKELGGHRSRRNYKQNDAPGKPFLGVRLRRSYPNDEDGQVLARIEASGMDMSIPTTIEFVVAVPDKATSCLIAKTLQQNGFTTEEYYDEGEPDYDEEDEEEFGPSWTVYVPVKCIPSYENVVNTQQKLESIVNDLGGKVDGWELKLSKA